MKKVYLFLSALIIFSCTSDSNNLENTNESTSKLMQRGAIDDLKDLYQKMITSEDYIESSKQIKIFLEKMNFDGSDTGILNDETKMLNWISANISKTSFKDLDEASIRWKNIKLKQSIIIKDNLDFFKALDGSKSGDLSNVMDPYTPPVANSGPCENKCINDAVDCDRTAKANYDGGMSAVARLTMVNPALAAAAASYVTLQYSFAQQTCVNNLNRCIGKC
ncbi:MAG: hypothetical protein JNM71_09920 [Flavobacterium lindanitolerans]|uniref:hypothetical protein n=1 Tax=Flavobacterium lindanitolerans TaxID=428988 RepID=UPI001A52A326|nr:hypothetical protein [Flavobacterium lindanitolerans]MBL7868326.1 hypothetical protein [Flavobacterium lindanitolerans]